MKGDALRRAVEALSKDEPVDWLALQAQASGPGEAEQLADLQALELMAQLAAPRGRPGRGDSAPDVPADWPETSRRAWGPIQIRGRLGQGAYGEVLDGWDTTLDREVALKLLPGLSHAAMVDEARRLARVRHPNVVTVFGADQHDGVPGLWMERVRGRTLEEVLAVQGPFSSQEATAIVGDVCSAVAALHNAGLVHRDIKAQNVMREVGGRVVLMDLGASVDLAGGDAPVAALAGTPLYMAPELFDGASPDVSSDVYALGVLLYRLVSDAFPIEARTVADVRAAHATGALRPLRAVRADLPADFVALTERAMAARPEDRFASAGELERALRGLGGGSRGRVPRPRALWIAGALMVGVLSGALSVGVAWRAARQTSPNLGASRAPVLTLSDEQYRLYAGYADLAFARRADAPALAYDEVLAAYRVIRPALPGEKAIHGVLSLSGAWLRLAQGDIPEARKELDDARYQLKQSVGEDHPYTAIAAMVAARLAQREGRHADTATDLLRALRIRRVVLGLDRIASGTPEETDRARLAALSASHPVEHDTDGDGLLDILEAAVGLDPGKTDSDGDGVPDQDEDTDGDGTSNLLALGVAGDPFLSVAQVGAQRPFGALWQNRLDTQQAAFTGPPAGWSVSTTSQGGLVQRLPAGVRERAARRGFSLFVRAAPHAGLLYSTVDTSPAGPRFDLLLTRLPDSAIESRLVTDLVSQRGLTDRHAGSAQAPPLFELRHVPGEGVRLYRDGTLVRSRYAGHQQFVGGGVSFGTLVAIGGQPTAAATFHLVWLEVR